MGRSRGPEGWEVRPERRRGGGKMGEADGGRATSGFVEGVGGWGGIGFGGWRRTAIRRKEQVALRVDSAAEVRELEVEAHPAGKSGVPRNSAAARYPPCR